MARISALRAAWGPELHAGPAAAPRPCPIAYLPPPQAPGSGGKVAGRSPLRRPDARPGEELQSCAAGRRKGASPPGLSVIRARGRTDEKAVRPHCLLTRGAGSPPTPSSGSAQLLLALCTQTGQTAGKSGLSACPRAHGRGASYALLQQGYKSGGADGHGWDRGLLNLPASLQRLSDSSCVSRERNRTTTPTPFSNRAGGKLQPCEKIMRASPRGKFSKVYPQHQPLSR